ncbi:alpha/beta fold hydrolase [Meiothermus sp. QL-1]|uniref:alpha/beta fold hydrolase n=1 Tax=Meiothermus sp. QL-1 TaxID=2058095 RepID=UPI000E0A770D|nr:alpha/beta fold hydrolase [Meiothermus sp. QL-1]RDI95346.1 alpha/beta fold hydrolase [Meiothermus sp. QL-1]
MSVPIVFLHAFPYSPAMWAPQLSVVRGHPTLVPDILGFESLEQAAAHVLVEMDARGWQRAVFVGLSMGGYVIFRLWNLEPERFVGLVLADTRATPDTPEGRRLRLEQAERVEREGMAFFPEATLQGHLGATTHARRHALLEEVRQAQLQADPARVAQSLRALAHRPDSTPLLPHIAVPALVLVGEEDTLTPPAEARAMNSAIPDSRMLILPEAGHLANLENPKAFNTALLGFLQELR